MLFFVGGLYRHDDVRCLGWQQFVEFCFVEQARLPVEGDDLPLEAVGLHLALVVQHDVFTYAPNALWRLHQHGHLGGGLAQRVPVQV